MADEKHQELTTSVGHEEKHEVDVLAPDMVMAISTWIFFAVFFIILQKFAWSPIMRGLTQREEMIRKSLDDAKKAQEELANIDEAKESILAQANQEAEKIIAHTKEQAVELSDKIKDEAKLQAERMVNQAKREIDTEMLRVRKELQAETVNMSVELARKIIDDHMDEKTHSKYVDRLTKDMDS